MRVRILADMVVPGGRVAAGDVVDVPDGFGVDMIDLGWAEPADEPDAAPVTPRPPVEIAVQTPEEHAVALRQRRRVVVV